MKPYLLLSVMAIGLLSGCSTAFKSGQTPDDVYYSPGRDAGVLTKKEEDRQKEDQARYEEYVSSLDDRYLRMKVANRARWSGLDDFNYWYDSRYDFGMYNYYSYSNWNDYYAWGLGSMYTGWRPYLGVGYSNYGYGYGGGWYGYGWSPLYTVISYGSPKAPGYTAGSNISAYRNKQYNNSNLGYKDPKTGAWVNNGSNNSFGNLMKRVFSSSTSGNNNTQQSWDRPTRTYTPTNNNTPPATSSSAGGNSGGFKSTGSSTSSGRPGRN
ncbi:hypothetical protein [Sediminibacterium ginsengisoli]|uniref:Vitellogenin II n=1 Tax=Sediminibacterium ginsengisoli TaxID=413434 RepID=A0A1T4QFS5_9BACT|nr:hypothetical protein [Sediminibacterium ginsengisoli]SKA02552.1 hypothetical protein SAMN04488132_108103 [Sediminibacterium ginsengisoli]